MVTEKQKALIGWIKENTEFAHDLYVQKFLFFYECFSKVNGDAYDFSDLKGYKNGPVFGDVYTENRYRKNAFLAECGEALARYEEEIDLYRAKLSKFIADVLGSQLSNFTHKLNIWAAKSEEIKEKRFNLSLDDADFNEDDINAFKNIQKMYSENYIDSVRVEEVGRKTFILFKEDKLTNEQYEALYEISQDDEIEAPVYVELDDDRGIIFD